jgi:hypothetical protein
MNTTGIYSFAELMDTLGYTTPPASWREGYDAAMACYPDGDVDFLTARFIHEVNGLCHYSADIIAALLTGAERIAQDAALRQLAWLWHFLMFLGPSPLSHDIAGWPSPEAAMGEEAGLFAALLVLSGVPACRARHAARGISEEVTRATLRDLEILMRHTHTTRGVWGFEEFGWLRCHLAGELFRLGRLQFMPTRYDAKLRAFRHRETGQVIALSEAGVRYRRDGFVDGTNGMTDAEAWTATLEINAHAARGHRAIPTGWVEQQMSELSLNVWEQVLAPGAQILDVHIPEDGRMEHDRCGASFAQALDFFPRHFPELPPALAFTCGSWLLDHQYTRILPESANIVRFLREFYLAPLCSDDSEPFRRVFAGKPDDLSSAPRDTRLRRAVLDFTLAGNRLHMASGFMLVEGFAWGSQRYQRE